MEKLKTARSNSKRSFTRVNRNLLKIIAEGAEPSLVVDCWNELQIAWSDIETKHNDYVSAMTTEAEIESEDAWMDEVYEVYSISKKAYFASTAGSAKNVKEEVTTNKTYITQPDIQKLKCHCFLDHKMMCSSAASPSPCKGWTRESSVFAPIAGMRSAKSA